MITNYEQEKAMRIALYGKKLATEFGIIHFSKDEFRIQDDYDTKHGRWIITIINDSYIIEVDAINVIFRQKFQVDLGLLTV